MRWLIPITLLGALLAFPQVAAGGECEDVPIVKIPLVIDATTVHVCIHHADEYGELGDIVTAVVRVNVPSSTTTAITVTAGTPEGCTAGTPVTRTWSTAGGSGSSHFNEYVTIDTTCSAAYRVQVLVSTTVLYDSEFTWTAACICKSVPLTGSGGTYSPQVVVMNGVTVMGPPNIIEVPYSTASLAIPLKLIAHMPSNPAGLSAGNTVTTTALDGTCTSASSGGGQVRNLKDGTSQIEVTETVTFNAEMCIVEWSYRRLETGPQISQFTHNFQTHIKRVEHPNIESWPPTDILDDTTDDGFLTTPASNVTIQDANINNTFPNELGIYSVQDHDGISTDAFFWVILWIVAMTWCLLRAKLFAAGAALIGIVMVLLPGPEFIAWVGILIFTLALWLEAVARERLYSRFINPQETRNPPT